MSARRGSKAAPRPREPASYALGDLVLGKVRGYSPWPGMVVDPANVPQVVAVERPKTASKTTFYCIRFFPTNEYAWLVDKDISRLKPHEIAAFLAEPGKKRPDLILGYKIAQDPAAWIEEMDAKAKAAAEAEGSDEDQVDELDSEGGDGSASAAKSKKRKRVSEAGVSAKKSKKGGETASAKAPKKAAASAKGRNGRKSKAAVESEDEHGPSASGAEDAGPSARKDAKEPPAKKAKKGQDADGDDEGAAAGEGASTPENVRVKDWRHKLQKTFLGKVPPKDEDMPDVDALFRTVEQTEVGIEGLQYSKIGKVMRHIAALTPSKVPRDAEFKFRERAKALVERWQGVLNAAKVPANGDKSTPAAGSPGKDDADAKAAKDTAAAIASATAGGGEVKVFEGESTADMLDAPGEKDVDAHGEADVDAPGEVESEVKGVEDGTAKMDLNGTGATEAHPPATSDATAAKTTGDVEMTDA